MYHFVEGPKIECSKCSSSAIEHVTYNFMKFMRCRGCGHESPHESVLPNLNQHSGDLFARAREQREQPVKF